jgi:hypothetical protein
MTAIQENSKTYFLQDSREHFGGNLKLWAAENGYSSDVRRARVFTEEEAFSQNRCRPTDIPWPTDYVRARTRPVVDMQYVKRKEADAYSNAEQFYLQRSASSFIGNDIEFHAKKGYTTNLNEAKIFTRAELFDGDVLRCGGIAWPKEYIDQKMRPAADTKLNKLEEALPDAKTKLAKPEKIQRERYRCHGCGIFLKIDDYYSCSGCPRCNADNRP